MKNIERYLNYRNGKTVTDHCRAVLLLNDQFIVKKKKPSSVLQFVNSTLHEEYWHLHSINWKGCKGITIITELEGLEVAFFKIKILLKP